jgi:hypothetical protein
MDRIARARNAGDWRSRAEIDLAGHTLRAAHAPADELEIV